MDNRQAEAGGFDEEQARKSGQGGRAEIEGGTGAFQNRIGQRREHEAPEQGLPA